MLIWHLVQPLVTWSRGERQQRLFHVCVQVQARLMARYPGYQPARVQAVPEAVVDDVKEMLRVLLRDDRDGGPVARGAGAAPGPPPGL